MPSSYRPAIDGLDNVIGYDTLDVDGKLIRRFNTEDEAIDFLLERDKPFVDPRTAAADDDADADAQADQDATGTVN